MKSYSSLPMNAMRSNNQNFKEIYLSNFHQCSQKKTNQFFLIENSVSKIKQNYDEHIKIIVKSMYRISINKFLTISLKTTPIMKQDNRRGAVITDKRKHQEKYFSTTQHKSICKAKQRSYKTNRTKNSESVEKNENKHIITRIFTFISNQVFSR